MLTLWITNVALLLETVSNVEEIKTEAPSLAHGSVRAVEFLETQTHDKSLYHLVFFPILTGPAR